MQNAVNATAIFLLVSPLHRIAVDVALVFVAVSVIFPRLFELFFIKC